MKGSNSLHINQATMVEAIQLWAEATFKEAPKINAVKRDPTYNMGIDCFIVEVDSEEGK